MTISECEIGKNGCETVQDVKEVLANLKTQQKNDGYDIVNLQKSVSKIEGLILKGLIAMGVLTGLIQVVLKYFPAS